jgi:thioredoxin 1
MIINLGSQEQFADVLKQFKQKRVLVDFYADWCGPCKMQSPVLQEFDKKDLVTIVKVNVDQFPELAEQYGVRSIPTLVVLDQGQIVRSEPGFKALGPLEKFVS